MQGVRVAGAGFRRAKQEERDGKSSGDGVEVTHANRQRNGDERQSGEQEEEAAQTSSG